MNTNKQIKEFIEKLVSPLKIAIIPNLEKSIGNMLISHSQQMIMCIIEYIVLDDYLPIELTTSDFKNSLVHYIDQFKKHLIKNKDHQLFNIIMKQMKIRQQELVEQQEGFLNTEEEDVYFSQLSINQNQSQQNYSDPEFQSNKVKETLTQKDVEIQNLIIKLENKERKILDLANGYLKDIQNLREQLFRKNDDFDYYEVQYLDITDIEEPKYRELVNNKISDLKSQYEKRTRELVQILGKQKLEINNLKQTVIILENKTKNLDNPEYLVSKLNQVQKDPYALWKLLSDVFGEQYFFDIFEKQKPSYGINYREINKMLMVTKAYDRELEYFKKGIEDQMCVFLERAIQVTNEQVEPYQEQIDILTKENDQLKKNNSLVQDNLDQQFKDYKLILKQHQLDYIELKSNELANLQKIQSKYAIKIWSLITKMNQSEQINLQLIKQAMSNDYQDVEMEQFRELEQKYLNLLTESEKAKMELQESQDKYQLQQITFNELVAKNKSLNCQIDEWKIKAKNYQKCLQITVKHIDPKINSEQLNLEDTHRETTKAFKEKIKELKKKINGFKIINEVNQQTDKNDMALDMLAQNTHQNQSTQTLIRDVSKSLEKAISNYEEQKNILIQDSNIFQEYISVQTQNNQTKDQFVQTTLEISDLEEILKQKQILEKQNQTLSHELNDQEQQFKINKHIKFSQHNNQLQIKKNLSIDADSHRSSSLKQKYGFINESTRYQEEYLNEIQQENSVVQLAQTQEINYRKLQSQEKKGVFNRLFEDSKMKQQRIEEIKSKLQVLESEHWHQIVQIISGDEESAHLFQNQIMSSRHFYQQRLSQNLELEQKCFPKMNTHHRAQFYFKKFKDFHLNQNDGSSVFQDVFKSDEKNTEVQRTNIKSVIESRQHKKKIVFNGLRREEQQFIQQLERNKQKLEFNKSLCKHSQYSPKQTRFTFYKEKPLNRSEMSCDMSDLTNRQITKHLQRVYDLV